MAKTSIEKVFSNRWVQLGALVAGGLALVRSWNTKGVGLISHLATKYDSRASFYGKAVLDDQPDSITLYSYNTAVAKYNKYDDTLDVYGWYSNTTARHIREFAHQLGFSLPAGSNIKGTYVK